MSPKVESKSEPSISECEVRDSIRSAESFAALQITQSKSGLAPKHLAVVAVIFLVGYFFWRRTDHHMKVYIQDFSHTLSLSNYVRQ
jgi:hypothetical protein